MRLRHALFYWLGDKRWPGKLLIAFMIAAVPVLGFFAIKGWEFEISVRVRRGNEDELPGWSPVLGKAGRGLAIRLAGIAYNLPTYVLLVAAVVMLINLFGRLLSPDLQTWAAVWQVAKQDVWGPLGALALAGFYALAANILYWSGYLRYIETREFLAFFDVLDNVRFAFENIWDDLVMSVFMFIVTLGTGLLGSALTGGLAATGIGAFLAPIIVPGITLTLNTLVSGHLFGQLAERTLPQQPELRRRYQRR